MTAMVAQQQGYGPPTPVQIFQWQPEFEAALELYRRLRPTRVLEIGTYHGGTLYHWLQEAEPGALVVSVDSYAVGVDNRHMYDDWVPSGVRLEVIEGDSRDPRTRERVIELSPEYDWIFIDAGHYLAEVQNDWQQFGSLAPYGSGVVLFHDILPPNSVHPEIEVAFLWAEIKQHHRTLEIVWDRDATWGGIGVVLL